MAGNSFVLDTHPARTKKYTKEKCLVHSDKRRSGPLNLKKNYDLKVKKKMSLYVIHIKIHAPRTHACMQHQYRRQTDNKRQAHLSSLLPCRDRASFSTRCGIARHNPTIVAVVVAAERKRGRNGNPQTVRAAHVHTPEFRKDTKVLIKKPAHCVRSHLRAPESPNLFFLVFHNFSFLFLLTVGASSPDKTGRQPLPFRVILWYTFGGLRNDGWYYWQTADTDTHMITYLLRFLLFFYSSEASV